jgi:hypothetical protein
MSNLTLTEKRMSDINVKQQQASLLGLLFATIQYPCTCFSSVQYSLLNDFDCADVQP